MMPMVGVIVPVPPPAPAAVFQPDAAAARGRLPFVMAGAMPAVHDFICQWRDKDVDARNKSAHDVMKLDIIKLRSRAASMHVEPDLALGGVEDASHEEEE